MRCLGIDPILRQTSKTMSIGEIRSTSVSYMGFEETTTSLTRALHELVGVSVLR
jgi:hypothetical protein